MNRLHDSVYKKFVNTIDLDDEWEIETDDGFKDITSIHKTIEYDEWEIVLENDYVLRCADEHIVFNSEMNEVFVKDLKQDDYVITDVGPLKVISVEKTEFSSNMYDIEVISNEHRYYTNGILSHNTTTAVALLLHYVLFNEHKTVAILANKGDAAQEVLSRIQLAYEALPKWLQQGIEEWNKRSIELENGCKIFAGTTTSSAIRGKTISVLYIDECIGGHNKVCVEIDNRFYYSKIMNAKELNKPRNKNQIHVFYKTVNNKTNKEYEGVYQVDSYDEILYEKTISGSIFKDGFIGEGDELKNDIERFKPENFSQKLIFVREDENYNNMTYYQSSKMKILGSEKFEDFDGFANTGKKNSILFLFNDSSEFSCSENHAIKIGIDSWALAKELSLGDVIYGKEIVGIYPEGLKETYSPMNVGNDFTYYSEGLYNHNCAFIEGWDDFFASVYPTISSGKSSKMLMTSTPNGLNHFYNICEGAKAKTNGYDFIEVMWYDVPGNDDKWKQETLEAINFDMEKFAQEYECAFLGSSGTLISGSALKSLVIKTPIYNRNGIYQYEQPIKDHIYVMTVDVSRGKGLDYSTFCIIDSTSMPYKQVCVFRDNMLSPTDYANVLHHYSKIYNDAHVLIELNDLGSQVADMLFFDFGCETMLFTENSGRAGKRISSGFGKNVERGITTSKTVKSVGCSILKLLIEQQQLIIHDHHTIEELSTFSKKGNSYQAESGKHDDLVMNLVLFSWLTDQGYFKEITDINTLINLREKTDEELFDDLLPFGIIDDGYNEINNF